MFLGHLLYQVSVVWSIVQLPQIRFGDWEKQVMVSELTFITKLHVIVTFHCQKLDFSGISLNKSMNGPFRPHKSTTSIVHYSKYMTHNGGNLWPDTDSSYYTQNKYKMFAMWRTTDKSKCNVLQWHTHPLIPVALQAVVSEWICLAACSVIFMKVQHSVQRHQLFINLILPSNDRLATNVI